MNQGAHDGENASPQASPGVPGDEAEIELRPEDWGNNRSAEADPTGMAESATKPAAAPRRSPTGDQTFSCPECGKRFPWRPEIVGQTVQCSCGHTVTAPTECEEKQYDVAAEPLHPLPVEPAAAGSAHPSPNLIARANANANANANAKPQPVLAYQTPELPADIDDYFPNKVMDLYLPIAILSIGAAVEFGGLWWVGSKDGPSKALARVGVDLVFSTGAMLLAIWIVAQLLGIGFGSFWSAVLKLSAVAVAPSAAMIVLFSLLHHLPLLGALIPLILGFGLYFTLLAVFFDLDRSDTWACVVAIFMVKIAMLVIAAMLGLTNFL